MGIEKGNKNTTELWFHHDAGICVHHFQYSAGRLDCLPHTHDEYNIVLCLKGGFDCVVNNACASLRPGDVLVINPGEPHCNRYGYGPSEARGISFHVTESAMKRFVANMRLPIDVERSSLSFMGKGHDPGLAVFGEELIHEIRKKQSGFEMVAQALVVQLMVHLLRNCLHPLVQIPKSLPRHLPSWQMVRALEYMNSHKKADFRLADLCASVGTGPTRFIQLFKNSVQSGLSPHSFYNHLVIQKAKRLLAEPASPIKAVCYELGFRNESHFSRVFRNCTSLTPRAFQVSVHENAGLSYTQL